jgi:hypothetical protein
VLNLVITDTRGRARRSGPPREALGFPATTWLFWRMLEQSLAQERPVLRAVSLSLCSRGTH